MPNEQKDVIQILIIDDHGLFRESLAQLLAAEPGFEIVAQCATTDEASGVLNDRSVGVILLDFDLGDSNCIKFVKTAIGQGYTGKVLVVTAGLSGSQAAELVRAGIAGIFLKHDLPVSLTQAIRDVVAGKVYLDQQLLRSTVSAVAAPLLPLTERERQVLSHVAAGLANKEIADRLGVSESSVKASLQQLFSKTGVRTRSQLVRIALEEYKNQL